MPISPLLAVNWTCFWEVNILTDIIGSPLYSTRIFPQKQPPTTMTRSKLSTIYVWYEMLREGYLALEPVGVGGISNIDRILVRIL